MQASRDAVFVSGVASRSVRAVFCFEIRRPVRLVKTKSCRFHEVLTDPVGPPSLELTPPHEPLTAFSRSGSVGREVGDLVDDLAPLVELPDVDRES